MYTETSTQNPAPHQNLQRNHQKSPLPLTPAHRMREGDWRAGCPEKRPARAAGDGLCEPDAATGVASVRAVAGWVFYWACGTE